MPKNSTAAIAAGGLTILALGASLASPISIFHQGAAPSIKITIDHNTNESATHAFKFPRVPSPASDNAARRAKISLVDGESDPNGAGLGARLLGVLQLQRAGEARVPLGRW